jgi:hypothetical protein
MLRLIRATSFSRKKHRRDANGKGLTHVEAPPVTIRDDMTEDEVLEYIATEEARRTGALPADEAGAATPGEVEASCVLSKPTSPRKEGSTSTGTLEDAQERSHCGQALRVEAGAAEASSTPLLSPEASGVSDGLQPAELTDDELLRYVEELENRQAGAQATTEKVVEDAQSNEDMAVLEAQFQKEIRTLAYRQFAAEERVHLEQHEAEELQLTRDQCGEKGARKVINNIIREEWRLLGHAGRAWYIERVRWECLNSSQPT